MAHTTARHSCSVTEYFFSGSDKALLAKATTCSTSLTVCSLKWLQRLEAPTGRLARWLFELQQYNCEVKYRRGILNRVVDALSRQPKICAARPLRCRWYRRLYDAVKREPAAHPDYRIEENKLYRHVLHSLDFKEHSTEEQWKTCVPRENREEVMQRYHDAPTVGHLGVAKTIARIAE
ncbi:reverse ribonuclease integrase, partial [Lasius niger]